MMPRVIQPGGGGGKMCMLYTAHRKRGLVAALKRMQAEVMTLGELCVTDVSQYSVRYEYLLWARPAKARR